MSDELDDGEFWLPSHFLVDDDNNLLTTFPCPIHSKASLSLSLSTSPQSTLFGCDCNLQDSLSASSSDNSLDSDTLELLNKAAGEVSKIQSRNETSTNTTTSTGTGTGFFDCSRTINMKTNNNTNTVPSARPRPHVPSVLPPSVSFQQRYPPRFPPPMMWGPVQLSQLQQQKIATKNNNENNEINNNNKRSQGLSPVAWPPLQVQGCHPVTSVFAGAPRETVGTGVFLPRRVGSPVDSKKKSVGNTIKTKNNNGSQQRNAHSIKDSLDEIELPSEWIY